MCFIFRFRDKRLHHQAIILFLILVQESYYLQPVREAVSYRGLFIAGWFGVREKHCSRLEIYDRLRASEQAVY